MSTQIGLYSHGRRRGVALVACELQLARKSPVEVAISYSGSSNYHIFQFPAPILLRSSFSAPRLMHTLRCVPCAEHPSLTVFDNLLREGISSITNSLPSDIQWLPVSLLGMGA